MASYSVGIAAVEAGVMVVDEDAVLVTLRTAVYSVAVVGHGIDSTAELKCGYVTHFVT